jgi:hypothetical protein
MAAAFTWWRVVDGVARGYPDTPAVRELVDARPSEFYGSIEGCILHGGVIATAFKRKTQRTFDARAWLETGAMVPAGWITTTEITASREA